MAAAQVVPAVVHPVLFWGGTVLPQKTLPALRAPAALEGSGGLEALTAAGALGFTLIQQR